MNKKLLLILILALVFSIMLPTASAYEYEIEEKTPDQYTYPVPDGLPVVDVESWEFRLANSYNSMGMYDDKATMLYSQGIAADILDQAVAFIDNAREAGYTVYINTGNRSWEWNVAHWQTMIDLVYGDANTAAKNMLQPGCDEHQTGLALDLTDNGYYADNYDGVHDPDFGPGNELFEYLCDHCAEYGFILRYPEGKEEYYGLACCKGHFRYVGVEAATYIMENNLCLEEFLMLYGYPVIIGDEVSK